MLGLETKMLPAAPAGGSGGRYHESQLLLIVSMGNNTFVSKPNIFVSKHNIFVCFPVIKNKKGVKVL